MLFYWRLLKLFWSTSITAELEYRANFILASLSSLGGLAGSLFGLFLFYQGDYRFQGWSWHEALIVLGIFNILQGVAATLLNANLNRIVEQVREGTLDFVLLKPVSAQFWLSLRVFSPWGLPDMIAGILLIGYAALELNLGILSLLRGLIPLGLGILSFYSLWFMLGTLSIWFVKIYNVTEVLRGLVEAGRFPTIAYPAAYRFFFTFVIPVAFLTTIPAEAILGRADGISIFASALLATGLLTGSHLFWRFALRFYTSASA